MNMEYFGSNKDGITNYIRLTFYVIAQIKFSELQTHIVDSDNHYTITLGELESPLTSPPNVQMGVQNAENLSQNLFFKYNYVIK